MTESGAIAKCLIVLASMTVYGYIAAVCVLGSPYILNLLLLVECSSFLPLLGIGIARRKWMRLNKLPTFFVSFVPTLTMFTIVAATWNGGSPELLTFLAALCFVPALVFWPFAWNIVRRIEFDRRLARRHKRLQLTTPHVQQ